MGTDDQSYWGQNAQRPLLAVSVAPLVGVLLALLAIWIAAVPAPTHAIDVAINDGCPESGEPKPVGPAVHIAIDFDDAFYWDGQLIPSRAALSAKMRDIGALSWDRQVEVHIRPNALASYGAVIAVLAAAQRNGVRKMDLNGLPWSRSIDWNCIAID